MGKKSKQSKKGFHKKAKRNTAVTFDAEDRQNYLKGMIGAKKRRRDFYNKKVEQEQKLARKQERQDYKQQRREELQKAKDLLQKLTGRVEDNYRHLHENKEQQKVVINKANNLIVETKFY